MTSDYQNKRVVERRGGFGVVGLAGAVLAAYCSWMINGSILWAIFHAWCGWLYMLYLCMGCGGGLPALPW